MLFTINNVRLYFNEILKNKNYVKIDLQTITKRNFLMQIAFCVPFCSLHWIGRDIKRVHN